jgi:hypothetical protein
MSRARGSQAGARDQTIERRIDYAAFWKQTTLYVSVRVVIVS